MELTTNGQKNHILLVEDEADHAELVVRAFEPHADEFQVTLAGSLSAARTALASSQPNLVIVDLLLLDGRGTELLESNGDTTGCPVLVVTSHGDEQVAVEAMKKGALDYVVKSEATLADMPHIARRALREWRWIAEREQAKDREKQLLSQLAHADRANTMGQMATVLAHQVNQPLAAIANYAGTCVDLLARGEISSDELREALAQIDQQAHRAGEIVNRLKRFIARAAPKLSGVNLNELVREACGLMSSQIQTRRTTLQLKLDDSLPSLRADSLQVQQVLVNLVQNALDAMEGIEPEQRRIIVTTAASADGVHVAVCDRGYGLSPEAAGKLFEPYFTSKPDGLGMGLNISRRIIEVHGGRLTAAPNRDGGMTFQFTLPLDRA